MKLYATTTSERAEKGQGGNEFLDVNFYFEDKNDIIGTITLKPNGELVFLSCDSLARGEAIANEIVLWKIIDKKAKKQKGECQHIETFSAMGSYCTHCKKFID